MQSCELVGGRFPLLLFGHGSQPSRLALKPRQPRVLTEQSTCRQRSHESQSHCGRPFPHPFPGLTISMGTSRLWRTGLMVLPKIRSFKPPWPWAPMISRSGWISRA